MQVGSQSALQQHFILHAKDVLFAFLHDLKHSDDMIARRTLLCKKLYVLIIDVYFLSRVYFSILKRLVLLSREALDAFQAWLWNQTRKKNGKRSNWKIFCFGACISDCIQYAQIFVYKPRFPVIILQYRNKTFREGFVFISPETKYWWSM